MHKTAAADDFQYFVCPHCDKVFTEATPYEGMQFDDDEDDADSVNEEDAFAQSQGPGRSRIKRKSKNGPGTDEMGFEPTSASSTWLKMSDHHPDAKLVPSTKVTFVKSILVKGFQEAPMDKVSSPISSHTLLLISNVSSGGYIRSIPPRFSYNWQDVQERRLEIRLPNR
jgi:hypothetical protein